MHTYAGATPLYHLDAWMKARGEAFLSDGGAEWLTAEGIAAVEWAENVADWLPEQRFEVELAHLGGDRRRIAVRWTGRYDRLAPLRKRPPGTGALREA
jgi:tRNA threonylcarbamoyladenosine biosynthesis protein TsaE